MVELVDTHLHLDDEQFDGERDVVVMRALDQGVVAMVTIGTSMATNEAAITLAERYDCVWVTVGIHPNNSHEWGAEAEAAVRAWAAHPKVVAIGEIGRDRFWDRVPDDVQQAAFEAQLALAAELGLPVVIHDREAHEPIMETLRGWVPTLAPDAPRGVLHFFSGDRAMAEEALDLGFYLGMDGPLTFKNAVEVRDVMAGVALDRVLVETDAPYLTPHPYRGRRNEPAFVRYVAEQLAELRDLPFPAIAEQTTRNARRLFQLNQEQLT